MAFAGKNVFITGGSSGIGKATALQLAAAGANLFILARDPRRLAGALEEIRAAAPAGSAIEGIPGDVRAFGEVCAAVGGMVDAGHIPDYLFNFAGIAHPAPFHELPLETFRDMMDTNYFGTVHTVKAVAPLMMCRRAGHIVNTSSVAGLLGIFGYAAYSGSKFAVRGFTDVLRNELKPYGVRVSILFPPDTDTPQLWEENKVKPAETRALAGNVKVMSPEEVARQLLAGVRRDKYLIIPGTESKLVYAGLGLLGGRVHLFLDRMVRQAQRRSGGPPALDLADQVAALHAAADCPETGA